jgi:hypothetical protein
VRLPFYTLGLSQCSRHVARGRRGCFYRESQDCSIEKNTDGLRGMRSNMPRLLSHITLSVVNLIRFTQAVSHRAQTPSSDCRANPRTATFEFPNYLKLTLRAIGDQLTLSVQRLYRCYLSYKNAYPMDTSINQWIGELWDHVSLKTGVTVLLTPEDLEKVCKLVRITFHHNISQLHGNL